MHLRYFCFPVNLWDVGLMKFGFSYENLLWILFQVKYLVTFFEIAFMIFPLGCLWSTVFLFILVSCLLLGLVLKGTAVTWATYDGIALWKSFLFWVDFCSLWDSISQPTKGLQDVDISVVYVISCCLQTLDVNRRRGFMFYVHEGPFTFPQFERGLLMLEPL